jgi:energy-coupling factor transport system substrate-specific component
MKNWKSSGVALFVLLCVFLNCLGKWVAEYFKLPLWLDSFGTVMTAFAMGPACGAIVGFTSDTIYGLYHTSALIYGLTGIVIGISVGIAAKKGCFNSLFNTMSASVVVTVLSVCVSVPLNLISYHGMTGNVFGDGVIGYLYEKGLPRFICYVVGEFYIDFLDKVITMVVILIIIRIYRLRRGPHDENKQSAPKTMMGILLVMVMSTAFSKETYCEALLKDFDSYVQTVYSTENGLPCGEANDVAQTKDGILWIGTYAGLYRYNGSEFRFMNYFESVRNVNCLYADEEGR